MAEETTEGVGGELAPSGTTVDRIAELLRQNDNGAAEYVEPDPLEPSEKVQAAKQGDGKPDDDDEPETGDEADDQAAAGEGDEAPAPPASLEEVAERLGMEVADLYNLTVGLGDERGAAPLSEIKDAYMQSARLEDRTEQLAFDKQQHENEVIRTRNELNRALALAQNTLSPELLAEARRQQTEAVARGQRELGQMFPQWQDEPTYVKDRTRMVEHAAEYGFSEAEFSNVTDPRLVKLLYDAADMHSRLAAARERIAGAKVPKNGRQPAKQARVAGDEVGTRNSKRLTRAAMGAGATDDDKVRAISALTEGKL